MSNSEILLSNRRRANQNRYTFRRRNPLACTGTMSELFQKERSVSTKHIKNVFDEGELQEESNVQILHISGSDRPVRFYNLNVIISVGYRV